MHIYMWHIRKSIRLALFFLIYRYRARCYLSELDILSLVISCYIFTSGLLISSNSLAIYFKTTTPPLPPHLCSASPHIMSPHDYPSPLSTPIIMSPLPSPAHNLKFVKSIRGCEYYIFQEVNLK